MKSSRIVVKLRAVPVSRACAPAEPRREPKHRIAEVLKQEGVSLRTIARRMGLSPSQAGAELDPQRDLRLSELFRWQSALGVPIADLLTQPGLGLSASIQFRAKLLKIMKTVRSIQEANDDQTVDSLTARLEGQLTELMPELKEVSSWPTVGKRRTLEEEGVIVQRSLPEALFHGSVDRQSRTSHVED